MWLLDNHKGTKKSCRVLVLLQNICFQIKCLTHARCEDKKEVDAGNFDSLDPSCLQTIFFVLDDLNYSSYIKAFTKAMTY